MAGQPDFPTTRWTLILNAAHASQAEGRAALASLCENYWYPLYAYARRRGYPADEARDLTQEFFLRLLDGKYLDSADKEKGRFRAFLLTAFRFFLSDEYDRTRAQKRGGGAAMLPFEVTSGEDRYEREFRDDETPERIYERRWALSTLERAVSQLRSEFESQGRLEQFHRLKAFILADADAPYAKLAQERGTSEGALKVSIHRFRKRYRELFRMQIAATVADPSEVDEELRFLAMVLSGA